MFISFIFSSQNLLSTCAHAHAHALTLLACACSLLTAMSPAQAQQVNIRVPGVEINTRGDVPGSRQSNTAEVQVNGSSTTIRNGVISNTQTGPGARAIMEIGGRGIEGNQVIVPGSSESETRTVRPRTGTAAGTAVQSGRDYVNQELAGASWARRDLRGANITNTNLQGADLSGANLASASIVNVDLSGARLNGANFRGANIVNVDLEDADLSQAIWVDGRSCRTGSIGRCL